MSFSRINAGVFQLMRSIRKKPRLNQDCNKCIMSLSTGVRYGCWGKKPRRSVRIDRMDSVPSGPIFKTLKTSSRGDSAAAWSAAAVYAWWICLYLVLLPYFDSEVDEQNDPESGDHRQEGIGGSDVP